MIRQLIFDLDGTLYPCSGGMEREVIMRMNSFTSAFLGIPFEEAVELRRLKMPSYGTTLEWLMRDHGFSDVESYFLSVHPDGEERALSEDPHLRAYLESIELPKVIFTNAPLEHAHRVLKRLRLEGVFDRIFDIRFSQFRGKPYVEAFQRVCLAIDRAPRDCVFIDDIPRYVQGFIDCGGLGLLVDESVSHSQNPMPSIQNLYELKPLLDKGFLGPLSS